MDSMPYDMASCGQASSVCMMKVFSYLLFVFLFFTIALCSMKLIGQMLSRLTDTEKYVSGVLVLGVIVLGFLVAKAKSYSS